MHMLSGSGSTPVTVANTSVVVNHRAKYQLPSVAVDHMAKYRLPADLKSFHRKISTARKNRMHAKKLMTIG